MSKLGLKLVLMVDITIVIIVAILVTITGVSVNTLNSEVLSKEASIGITLIKDNILTAETNARGIADDITKNVDFARSFYVDRGNIIGEKFSLLIPNKNYVGLFVDADNKLIWKSDGLEQENVQLLLNNEKFDGYYVSGNNIYYVCERTILNSLGFPIGKGIVAVDFSSSDMLDEIKEVVGFDVTIFGGDVRIATTVIDESGQRATGTRMSDKVREQVIDLGNSYEGRADIVGNTYYTIYEPFLDNSGNIMGAIFCGAKTEENDKTVGTIILISILAGVVFAAIGGIYITVYERKHITKPLRDTSGILKKMADGNIMFELYKVNRPNDEIGDMVADLVKMKDTISMYLGDVGNVMNAMAQGDFTVETAVEYKGDFVQMKKSVDKIRNDLSSIISKLTISASEVSSGSAQISNGSQLLAEGTTRQASAVEQLSATISEIAEKIEGNNGNAIEADKCATRSNSLVEEQSKQMHHMRAAMEDIKQKSDQIHNIIKTIEDIAFQTNILALNAAVEAARAGAAGKGFAVVADEVRNLATKSDEATKQTADIIDQTMDSIAKGSGVVEKTVELMDKVAATTNESQKIVEKIRLSSEEQAQAIEQIKEGINQISEVVQQNSATAEESAASCEELNGQSQVLADEVAHFVILEKYR